MANYEKSSSSDENTNLEPESAAGIQSLIPHDGGPHNSAKASAPTPNSASNDPMPPAMPPRHLSPREQAEKTLVEAFPSIDLSVVKAVLSASGGHVEPAFDALLGMTDPDSQKEAQPPAKPPRPAQEIETARSTARSQLESDEMYARQLHEHYSSTNRQQRPTQNLGPGQQASRQWNQGEEERERSFLDDDLPLIRENIRKGFIETQSTVNKWVTNFKKKLDGEEDEGFNSQSARPAQGFHAGNQGTSNYGRRSSEMARRSADRDRYDADPQVLGDDFSTFEIKDADGAPPKKPQRPVANPDLFKPGSAAPGSRKVSFQTGPPDEIDELYSGSSDPSKQQAATGKSSKWQPLSAVEPSAVAENDPFSVGDSDDDKETKVKENENESVEPQRLQTATAGAGVASVGDTSKTESATTKDSGTKT